MNRSSQYLINNCLKSFPSPLPTWAFLNEYSINKNGFPPPSQEPEANNAGNSPNNMGV